MQKPKYTEIANSPNVRWDTPPEHQGQIIEVAYADARPAKTPACHGAKYKRVTDRSDQSVAYYQRVN